MELKIYKNHMTLFFTTKKEQKQIRSMGWKYKHHNANTGNNVYHPAMCNLMRDRACHLFIGDKVFKMNVFPSKIATHYTLAPKVVKRDQVEWEERDFC